METHYQKYKETIKRVARRNYQKRVAWLNNHLAMNHVFIVERVKLFVLNFIHMIQRSVNKQKELEQMTKVEKKFINL